MIAMGLSAARPDLVRGLVLCDTGHRIGNADTWNQRIDAIRNGGIASIAAPILERWFSASFIADRADETAVWRALLVGTPAEGYIGTCMSIRDTDLTAEAGSISVPTLCLCGSEDGATPPELVRELSALIAGSRYEEVNSVGHLPCVEVPDKVLAHVKTFLKEL